MSKRDIRRMARKALLAARDVMNNHGEHWVQGYLTSDYNNEHNRAKSYCAIGGINHAFGRAQQYVEDDAAEGDVDEILDLAILTLGKTITGKKYKRLSPGLVETFGEFAAVVKAESDIIEFNDAPGRTWKQVSDAFTRAADSLKEQRRPVAA